MPRTGDEGLKPIGDSIRKIIDKVIEERKKRKKNRPVRTQPKLPGLNKGGGADTGKVGEVKSKLMVSGDQYRRNPTFENLSKVRKNIKQYKSKKDRSPQARKKMPTNDPSKLPAGLKKDTTTSAYGDAGRGRPVPKFKEGGVCRGAGAAVKGTKFQGVF